MWFLSYNFSVHVRHTVIALDCLMELLMWWHPRDIMIPRLFGTVITGVTVTRLDTRKLHQRNKKYNLFTHVWAQSLFSDSLATATRWTQFSLPQNFTQSLLIHTCAPIMYECALSSSLYDSHVWDLDGAMWEDGWVREGKVNRGDQ